MKVLPRIDASPKSSQFDEKVDISIRGKKL